MKMNKSKKIMAGIANVANLGGFIEQCLIDALAFDYPPEVVMRVANNTSMDGSVWAICDEVALVYKTITEFPDHVYSDAKDNYMFSELSPFGNWLLDQDIRCKVLKLKNNKKPFWTDKEIGYHQSQCASNMIALEERVMSYKLGYETGKEMSLEEIGNLPEFDCDVSWIERIILGVQDTFDKDEDPGLFDDFCEHFSRKEKEKNE